MAVAAAVAAAALVLIRRLSRDRGVSTERVARVVLTLVLAATAAPKSPPAQAQTASSS